MAGYAFLGVETGLHPDWANQMGGPTVPSNWKDPKKIEAKIQEWQETAMEKSPDYPLARIVGAWTLLNDKGKAVSEGSGAVALIALLNQHDNDITQVLGVNARAVLKGASIEVMELGGAVPKWCWYFAPMDNEHTRVFDPIDMLTSSFREKMDSGLALQRLGLPLIPTPAAQQATFCLDLAKKLGLV